MKLRLLHNYIDEGGKHHSRGEILDDATLPKHIRNNPQLCSKELNPNAGKVLLLRTVIYSVDQWDAANNRTVSYPVTLAAGQSVALEEIPPRQREGWVEGDHYRSEWTESDQRQLQYEENQRYLGQFTIEDGNIGLNPGALR
jgi:hypothetical protein